MSLWLVHILYILYLTKSSVQPLNLMDLFLTFYAACDSFKILHQTGDSAYLYNNIELTLCNE